MKYILRKFITHAAFLALIIGGSLYAKHEHRVGYEQGVIDCKAELSRPHPTPPVMVMPWMEPVSQERQAELVRNAWLELRKGQVSE